MMTLDTWAALDHDRATGSPVVCEACGDDGYVLDRTGDCQGCGACGACDRCAGDAAADVCPGPQACTAADPTDDWDDVLDALDADRRELGIDE